MEKDTLKRFGKAIASFGEGFFGATGVGCCGLEVPPGDLRKLKQLREPAGAKKQQGNNRY